MSFQANFNRTGDFEAWYECQQWLTERGYSFGSTCVMSPVGVLKGEYSIAKWRNLSAQERAALDGTVTGDFRNGPLTLVLKEAPELVAGRDYVALPEHLNGIAESAFRMAENGENPDDVLKMLARGLNKCRPKT